LRRRPSPSINRPFLPRRVQCRQRHRFHASPDRRLRRDPEQRPAVFCPLAGRELPGRGSAHPGVHAGGRRIDAGQAGKILRVHVDLLSRRDGGVAHAGAHGRTNALRQRGIVDGGRRAIIGDSHLRQHVFGHPGRACGTERHALDSFQQLRAGLLGTGA